MENKTNPKETVLSYIKCLDNHNYLEAGKFLSNKVKVIGPSGEAFTNPDKFVEMLSKQQGKYKIEKIFVDGDDVCLLYNFIMASVPVYMSSWYQVKDDKIIFIKTIFDSKALPVAK